MIVTIGKIEKAYNNVRQTLANIGILGGEYYLDQVELTKALVPSLFGEVGYVFSRDTTGLYKLLGFKAGVIYLPNTFNVNVPISKKELENIIFHEFGHAWEWIDQKYFKEKWFQKAFNSGYDDEYQYGQDLFSLFGNSEDFFTASPYYNLYITPYAMTSPAEDFAETFSVVCRDWNDLDKYKSRREVYKKIKIVRKAIEIKSKKISCL